MAITINWATKVISVPRTDMILIQSTPTEIRQLDIDDFRLALKNLEDDTDGMTFLDTHRHNPPVSVGGAILARVIEIINGYTVTFEDGQYAVNLVGANSNIGDVVNVNQVSVRSSNSAGLQDLNSLQAASFAGSVAVDTSSSYSGTIFPVGTRQYPVNNTEDAIVIALGRGLRKFLILGDIILSSSDFSQGFIFQGENPVITSIELLSDANVTDCQFINATVSGVLDNNNSIKDCVVVDILQVNGHIDHCALTGTISLAGTQACILLDCYSGLTLTIPIIDLGGEGQELLLRNYSGDVKIVNKSGPESSSISLLGGSVELDSTVTNGTIIVYGPGELVNNSTGTTTVVDKTGPALFWARTALSTLPENSFGAKLRRNLTR